MRHSYPLLGTCFARHTPGLFDAFRFRSQIHYDERTLSCGHVFHTECLRGLAGAVRLAASTRRTAVVSCPLCRAEILEVLRYDSTREVVDSRGRHFAFSDKSARRT